MEVEKLKKQLSQANAMISDKDVQVPDQAEICFLLSNVIQRDLSLCIRAHQAVACRYMRSSVFI
jgi:hypothetical protein